MNPTLRIVVQNSSSSSNPWNWGWVAPAAHLIRIKLKWSRSSIPPGVPPFCAFCAFLRLNVSSSQSGNPVKTPLPFSPSPLIQIKSGDTQTLYPRTPNFQNKAAPFLIFAPLWSEILIQKTGQIEGDLTREANFNSILKNQPIHRILYLSIVLIRPTHLDIIPLSLDL